MMSAAGATTVEAPRERGLARLFRRARTERSVSFPELVWAHFLRQKELRDRQHEPYAGPAEKRYRDFEARFEARHGQIVQAYWCSGNASAAAITIKRRPLILADVVQLHWAADWSTKDLPKLMALLYRCESLSVRIHEVLRDTSQRLATESLFTVMSHVLGFAETSGAHEPRAVSEVVRTSSQQLRKIEGYYREAAVRSGQIVYVTGMLLGMIPIAVLAVVASALLGSYGASPSRVGAMCFAAGGVGALISVMSRMNSGKVHVDWEFGKDTARTLGLLRPYVGAVFGLMTYLALKGNVVSIDVAGKDNAYFFVLFAFVAGFSERFAQDLLLRPAVESVVSRGRRRPRQEPEPDADELADAPTPSWGA
jgi:hypothetical protein